MKLLAFLFLSVLLAACIDQGKTTRSTPETNMTANGTNESYLIDRMSVTKNEFDRFLASLKENQGSWFCAEFSDGGETGYDAADKKGAVYQVRLRSTSAGSRNSITRKGGDLPIR